MYPIGHRVFTSHYPARRSVRALLFDQEDTLLFHGIESVGEQPFYTTFGGGVEADEGPVATLTRELYEELDATVVVGREVLALPGHRYHVARVTHLGNNPFTYGPEFANNHGQRFWVERVSYKQAQIPEFNLQPTILKTFLHEYEVLIRHELALLTVKP